MIARVRLSQISGVLAETLLKHAIEPFEPAFVNQPEATLGRIVEMITGRNAEKQAPYADRVFGDLIAVKSSHPDLFSQLSEPHHTVSEAITVREAKQIYEFWTLTLFPAVRKVWEEYRFLQKSIVGEVAAIPLPANCNHKPHRSDAPCGRPAYYSRASLRLLGRACRFRNAHRSSGRARCGRPECPRRVPSCEGYALADRPCRRYLADAHGQTVSCPKLDRRGSRHASGLRGDGSSTRRLRPSPCLPLRRRIRERFRRRSFPGP